MSLPCWLGVVGIVRLPEDVQQVVERDDGWVVRDLDHLGMPSMATANSFVGGVDDVAAAVAGDDRLHTF